MAPFVVTTPTAAERVALDLVAEEEAARWHVRDGRIRLTGARRSRALELRAWRRPPDKVPLPPIRLRFDRVALRVCSDLRAAAPALLPAGRVGFVTIRAPIRVAAKTIAAISASMRRDTPRQPRSGVVLGNHVWAGSLPAPRRAMPQLACFIHTHDADAARLLAMTRNLLTLGEAARQATCLVVRTSEQSASLSVYRHILEQIALELPYRQVFMIFRDGQIGQLLD